MNKYIYVGNIIEGLNSLSDRHYQENVWLNKNNPEGLVDSFVEAANMLGDCAIDVYLKQGEIIFDRATTAAFHELEAAIDAVNEYQPEAEIIADPLMEIVRQKAAKVLALIEVSDVRESTVEILD